MMHCMRLLQYLQSFGGHYHYCHLSLNLHLQFLPWMEQQARKRLHARFLSPMVEWSTTNASQLITTPTGVPLHLIMIMTNGGATVCSVSFSVSAC